MAVAAREQARKAQAERRRKVLEKEKKITTALSAFYRATTRMKTARQKATAAEQAQAKTVQTLAALVDDHTEVAELCQLELTEVRRLLRAVVPSETPTAAEEASAVETSPTPESPEETDAEQEPTEEEKPSDGFSR